MPSGALKQPSAADDRFSVASRSQRPIGPGRERPADRVEVVP